MSLSVFVHSHHDEIIREFAAFAKTLMPAGVVMTTEELRDHAEELLTAIVVDMAGAQTHDEQSRKSMGTGRAQGMADSGQLHADARILHGFSLRAVLAEFRALRATVLRLYESSGESDLTEVRRFNESIDEALTESMNRYAARTDAFRDQFVGILSHDLRNPLGAITTGAALLAVPEDNPQRRARVAARILNSSQRMGRMIADLLDLTQARLGGVIPLSRVRTDLQRVCEEVMLEIHAAYPEAILHLEKRGNLHGDWDADRLAQVVSNLVGNAMQHGDGTAITLDAHEEDGGDRVVLAVHNRGVAIAPEAIPFIFEPLARGPAATGDANAGHSIGLGLFIARAVVSAHGGEIRVSSSPTSGTTFTVLLPRSNASTSRHSG
jgi:signal transduction histidine kinase